MRGLLGRREARQVMQLKARQDSAKLGMLNKRNGREARGRAMRGMHRAGQYSTRQLKTIQCNPQQGLGAEQRKRRQRRLRKVGNEGKGKAGGRKVEQVWAYQTLRSFIHSANYPIGQLTTYPSSH